MVMVLLLCVVVGFVFYRTVIAPFMEYRRRVIRRREFWYPRR
jgi:hypothetical protein